MGRLCTIDESAARRRKEDAAAERREARWPAIRLVISSASGDGSARETDHRVRRFRTSALSALCSPHFFPGSGTRTKGHPPPPAGPAERCLAPLSFRVSEYRERGPESITPALSRWHD